MHLESLIEDLGGFGCYQGILLVLIAMTKVTLAGSMLMMAFAGVDPGWWCLSPEEDAGSLYLTPENASYKNCDWNQTCIRHFDQRMVTIVTEWDLTCDKKWISNTVISIQMAGVLLGSIISGHIADGYGRKKVLFLSVLLGIITNIVSAFSVGWIMFTVLRVVLGIAVGMMISVNYLYIAEFVGKEYRSFIAAIPSWGIGVVLFAGLVWGIPHWKWLHLATAAIAFPFLFGWFFVPESLRWLAAKGRLDEARLVINAMAKYNKKPIPDTAILELIAAEEKVEGDKARSYTYLDLFRTKSLMKRTVLTCYIWFSLSVVYYAISFGVKKLSGDFFVNMMIMAVLELPVLPGVLIVTSVFGRRWSCASLFFLTSFSCIAVGVANRIAPPEMKGTLENVFAILARFLAITVWHIVQALTSEQFPTVIRNLSYAANSTTARVGGILAGQVLSLGGKDDLMPPFIAMGVLIFLNGVACFFLRETKGVALEDTMTTEYIFKAQSTEVEMKIENGNFVSTSETEVTVEHACVNDSPVNSTDNESRNKGIYVKLLTENTEDTGNDRAADNNEKGDGKDDHDGLHISETKNGYTRLVNETGEEAEMKNTQNGNDNDNKSGDRDGNGDRDGDEDEGGKGDGDEDKGGKGDGDEDKGGNGDRDGDEDKGGKGDGDEDEGGNGDRDGDEDEGGKGDGDEDKGGNGDSDGDEDEGGSGDREDVGDEIGNDDRDGDGDEGGNGDRGGDGDEGGSGDREDGGDVDVDIDVDEEVKNTNQFE